MILNKEALILAGNQPVMGWIVKVEWIGWGWGGASTNGHLTTFGGAPELTAILSVGDTLVTTPELPNGSKLRRADTGQIFTIGEHFKLFTEADSGKTITVYYIPA